MKRLLYPALLLAGILSGTLTQAFTLEEFTFDDPAKQREFRDLIGEIRCLVCQNESLAASQADLAQDLRMEVYKMLQSGKTREEVVEFLVSRYGDFVLYEPPLRPSTYLIWFGPALLVAAGSFVLFSTLRSKRKAPEKDLSDNDRDRHASLLAADTPADSGSPHKAEEDNERQQRKAGSRERT